MFVLKELCSPLPSFSILLAIYVLRRLCSQLFIRVYKIIKNLLAFTFLVFNHTIALDFSTFLCKIVMIFLLLILKLFYAFRYPLILSTFLSEKKKVVLFFINFLQNFLTFISRKEIWLQICYFENVNFLNYFWIASYV